MQSPPRSTPDGDAKDFELPTPAGGLAAAKLRLAGIFRRSELVWLAGEHYDPAILAWDLDIVRQDAMGRWIRQRYRFDEQSQTLYFMGERPLTEAEFTSFRRHSTLFSVAEWQDRAV